MYRMFLLILMFFSFGVNAAELAKKEAVVSTDYVLGTGDLIKISVYGNPDMLTEARLSASGKITFPLIGEIKLGGLSSAQAEKKIADLLEQGAFVKKAQVNLVVMQFQSQFVSVLGDVYKPGKYPLDRPSNLSDLLALAGGVTPNGSDMITHIRTVDGKSVKHEYDMRDLITNADAASNPQVIGDDIIFINSREVSVLGQVNRPGKYSVIGGVRTVLDFLSQAGGIAPTGADKVIVITNRNGKTIKHEIDVDLLYQKGDTSTSFELAHGDSIYVPRTPIFYIYGEVQRPGSFRLERNMNVAQALSTGGGLTPRGTERGIKIKRQVNGVLETLDSKPSDILQPEDVVFVKESLY